MTQNGDTSVQWLTARERGTALGMRWFVLLATVFGRAVPRVFLTVVIAYYAVFFRSARRSSAAFLERVHGRKVGFGTVYRHLLRFGQVTLDRLFLVRGQLARFTVTRTGHEHLSALRDSRRGAVLLGAHLGSFEAMRIGGEQEAMKINILAYVDNAKMINEVLSQLDPAGGACVLAIRPGSLDAVFAAKERVEAGEFVALLGDRVGLNPRTATVQFMGAPARLPTGPYILAALLGCPVYLTFGLYRGGDRYDLYCEPFSDKIVLPRGKAKARALEDLAQRYASRVEHYARQAPDNWFNFYDFWGDEC